MNLIQMSVAAGVLILGIVLFRSLFIHRLPKKVMILLWEIAILRLLMPFSIPLPLPEPLTELRSLIVSETSGEAKTETYDISATTGEEAIARGGLASLYIVEKEKSEVDLQKAAAAVYLAVTVILLAGSLFVYTRDSRLFREGLPMPKQEREKLLAMEKKKKKDVKVLDKVRFQISDRTATPVTYGLLRPAVVFPKGQYLKEGKEVSFCLQHELIHIKNHDNLKKLAAHLALCIHWFNPLVWVMYVLFNRDMELLCDETVVQRNGGCRQEYALTLLSLAQCRNMGFQTGLGFGKNAVKERIVAVMTMKKTTFIGILATVIALTSAFTVFVTNTVSDTRDGAESSLAGTYVVSDTPEWVSVTWKETAAEAAEQSSVLKTRVYSNNVLQSERAVYVTTDSAVELSDAVVQVQEAVSAEVVEDTVYEGTALDEDMEETIDGLISEFEMYGLSGEVKGDDYQLYFNGEPVYFLADNQKQNGDGFSGRVFAKAADAANGNTGVITKYNDDGTLIGLVQLSEKDSRAYARTYW